MSQRALRRCRPSSQDKVRRVFDDKRFLTGISARSLIARSMTNRICHSTSLRSYITAIGVGVPTTTFLNSTQVPSDRAYDSHSFTLEIS